MFLQKTFVVAGTAADHVLLSDLALQRRIHLAIMVLMMFSVVLLVDRLSGSLRMPNNRPVLVGWLHRHGGRIVMVLIANRGQILRRGRHQNRGRSGI